MNSRIIVGALLVMCSSISMAQDKFQISGKLSAEGMVVLNYVDQQGKNAKDSALLKKGTFVFNGATAFGNKAYLSLLPVKKDTSKRQGSDSQEFYLENVPYKVTGKDSIASATITGGQAQKDYVEFNALMGEMLKRWRQLNQDAMKVMREKDSIGLKKIQAEGRPLYARMESTMDSFIFSHPDSYVTVDLVNDNKTSVIDPRTFDKYYSALSSRVLASFNGKKMKARYDKARQMSIGKAFDFTQNDINDKPFALSSLRGKYVLVDFWASWCAPCRAENPNLLKAYNQLKDRKFEIVGISLDESKAAWLKAVEKDGMPWIQVSDLKGWKNEVAVQYGVTAVPQNLLVDPKGIIIAKNLRGEELQAELEKLIK